MKSFPKLALFANLIAIFLINRAHAFGYTCPAQTTAGHVISLSINDNYGPAGHPSARYQIDNNQTKGYPTMNDNGSGSFESNDKDMEVNIDQFSDENGKFTLHLSVRSLGIKNAELNCD